MQAITTKFFGPSNVKGARIKATCEAGSITIGYRHELTGEGPHAAAAMALVRKLGWQGDTAWVCASTKDGYAFVPKTFESYSSYFS
jgi:hypothetical protein